MELIAADISNHLQQIPEGMKGQLACSSKAAAIRYKELFDELGLVTSAVVISAPDSREGYEEVDEAKKAIATLGGMTPDAALLDVEDAMAAMGEVTGGTVREDITARIFERFCVGK